MEVKFEREAVEHMLEPFGRTVDEDGYIIKEDTGEYQLNPDGDRIKAEDLAMVEHGSDIFVDDSFGSLVEHVERQR